MFNKAEEKYNQKVYEQYKDCLNDISDLFVDGYDGMSNLFYLCNKRYLHWLDNDPEIAVSEKEILFRRKFYKVLQKISFIKHTDSQTLRSTCVLRSVVIIHFVQTLENDIIAIQL